MKPIYFLLFLFSFLNGIAQTDDCGGMLLPSGGGCSFSSSLNTASATSSVQTAYDNSAKDDDVWFLINSPISSPSALIKAVIQVKLTGLVFTAGPTPVTIELWKNCGDATYLDYFVTNGTATDTSCVFRNLNDGSYYLRVYTNGNSSRLSNGNLCVTNPCRTTSPGASCQGGYGIGAEDNNDSPFGNPIIVPQFEESGCTPSLNAYNTIYTTQSSQTSPNPGSVDDDCWFIFETSEYNRITFRLTECEFVQPGTQVVAEIWNQAANMLIATSAPVAGSSTTDITFNTPEFSQNTIYKLRLYTLGSGAMVGIKKFKLCEVTSITNYDEATTAANLAASIVPSCNYFPLAPFFYTTSGATASPQAASQGPASADDDVWFNTTTPALINALRVNINDIRFYTGFGPVTIAIELWNNDATVMLQSQIKSAVFQGDLVRFLFSNLTASTNYKIRIYTVSNTNRLYEFRICSMGIPTPANDDCAGATPITATNAAVLSSCTPAATVYSTEGATASSQTPAFATMHDDDVWFSFSTNTNTQATVQLSEIEYVAAQQGVIAELWSSDCMTMVAASNVTFGSSMRFSFNNLGANTNYKLRLYSYNTGSIMRLIAFKLCITLNCNAPAGDVFTTAPLVSLNNMRSNASYYSVGSFSTCGASASLITAPACSPIAANVANDIFIKFVAVSSTTHFNLASITNVSGGNNNLNISLYRYNPFTFQYEAQAAFCTNSTTLNITDRLIIGDTFMLRIFNTSPGSETNFLLQARTPLPPGNDTCTNAIEIPPHQPYIPQSNAIDASSLNAYKSVAGSLSTCFAGAESNSDIWFKLRPPINLAAGFSRLRFTELTRVNNIGDANSNGSYDINWVLYTGGCASLTEVACGSATDLLPALSSSAIYYIKVFSVSAQAQVSFKLSWEILTPSSNTSCATAEVIPALSNYPDFATLAWNPADMRTNSTLNGGVDANDCFVPYPVKGVWYKFQATATKHTVRFRYIDKLWLDLPFADVAIRLYAGNDCGTLAEQSCISSVAMQSGLLSGLTVGNWYYIRIQATVNAGDAQFQFGIYGANIPPPNNEYANRKTLVQSPVCLITERDRFTYATLSPEALTPAATAAAPNADVWYRFRASCNNVSINIYGALSSPLGYMIYTDDLTTVVKDYTSFNGSDNSGALLIPGVNYAIRLFNTAPVGAEYQICLTGVPTAVIATAPYSSCTDADENPRAFNGVNYWKHFTSGGNLVLSVFDDQPTLGNVSARFYLHPSGGIRTGLSGQPYLSRNVGIIRTGTAGPRLIQVMLYITKQELDEIVAANTGALYDVSYLNDLRIYRFPSEECGATIFGSSSEILPIMNYGLLPGTTNVYYIMFQTTNFSGFFIQNTPTGVLSQTLSQFTANAVGNNAQINWTLNNPNVTNTEVQASTDGVSFASINNTATRLGVTQYSHLHAQAASMANKVYYRLKLIMSNGSINYSNIQFVQFNKNSEPVTVFPNPSTGIFTINNYTGAALTGNIISMQGRVIGIKQFLSASNTTVNLTAQPAGLYFIKLSNGQTLKLVKQ
jgi:hypothetical protein